MSSGYTPGFQHEIYQSVQARSCPGPLLYYLVCRDPLERGVCKYEIVLAPLLEDRHVHGYRYPLGRIAFGATAARELLYFCSAETPRQSKAVYLLLVGSKLCSPAAWTVCRSRCQRGAALQRISASARPRTADRRKKSGHPACMIFASSHVTARTRSANETGHRARAVHDLLTVRA